MSQYLKDANKMERVCYNRMRAAELARDSVFALVPCQEMARDSGALGSYTGEARDSSGVCRMEVARAGALHKTSTKTCFGKK